MQAAMQMPLAIGRRPSPDQSPVAHNGVKDGSVTPS